MTLIIVLVGAVTVAGGTAFVWPTCGLEEV